MCRKFVLSSGAYMVGTCSFQYSLYVEKMLITNLIVVEMKCLELRQMVRELKCAEHRAKHG